MNDSLSIGTDTVCETDVLSVSATDADENVVVDVKHLTVDPENVTRFREQLHSESQSKETESTSTAEGATKHDIPGSPILKHSAPNERNFFGNNNIHTPPSVAGKAHTCPSQSQNTDGSRKDFHEKSMKFDISSQSAPLKTAGGALTDNITHEEHVAYKSPFFEAPDPSKISVKNTKNFRETFTNTETLLTDMSLRTLSGENKTNFSESVSQSRSDLPQPSPTLKSPATLLRELQNPTTANAMPTLEATTNRVQTALNAANMSAGNVMREVPVVREPKYFETLSVPTEHATASKEFSQELQSSAEAPSSITATNASEPSLGTSASSPARASEAVTQVPSRETPLAETLHAPENHTTPHSTTTSVFNAPPSLTDAFAKDGTVVSATSLRSSDGSNTVMNASIIKPTGTKQRNVSEISKPLSKTVDTASTAEYLSGTNTRERPRTSDNTSDTHRTTVWETIPFLRTTVETTTPVQESIATQQTQKSHAMLIAQQIRDHIIDRILISSSALNDNRTVTVQLSPRLLRDTEVQFTQNGTSLDIRLVSQNKDSVQFLQQHQSDLQTYLQGELKTYRAISVRVPSSQTTSELAQPHDGRSRNRFEYQPADEEETT